MNNEHSDQEGLAASSSAQHIAYGSFGGLAAAAARHHQFQQNGMEDDTSCNDSEDDSYHDPLALSERLINKTKRFTLPNDANRGYRGTELKLLSFSRPHMRAFHGSWLCFFASFFLQFAMAPLLPPIRRSLNLTHGDIWLSNVWSVVGGVPVRFLLGPLCEKYGGKTIMTGILAASAIPCFLSSFVFNLVTLTLVRFAMGAMDTFVAGQFWITCHFIREVSGTAMAISSGWGATGSAVTQLVMGSILFPLCCVIVNQDINLAWRLAMIFPGVFALGVAGFFYAYSDDSPLGDFQKVKRAGLMIERSAVDSFRSGALNLNSWLLFLQHAGSYGVDLTMCVGTALYYNDRFHQPIAAAGAIAFSYGISAIFARGLGGYISDQAYSMFSLRGRLYAQMVCMIIQGLLTLVFAGCASLLESILVMIAFSIFVQMSMGTCFGIVPYVDGPNTGSIAGIVGAGGNFGAILLGLFFRSHKYATAFRFMGWFTIALSCLTPLIVIKGYRCILFGKEEDKAKHSGTLMVPIGASPVLRRAPSPLKGPRPVCAGSSQSTLVAPRSSKKTMNH